MFHIQSRTSAVLTQSFKSSVATQQIFYSMNPSEKADVLSKTSCHHSDFHCRMRIPKLSAPFPNMILSNKHMFHVKHIATNIGLGSLSFIRSTGIAAIACTLVLIFSG